MDGLIMDPLRQQSTAGQGNVSPPAVTANPHRPYNGRPVKKLFMLAVGATIAVCLVSCAEPPPPIADLILVNGRIYTLTWAEPDGFGNPAGEAPRGINGWHPDAEAIAII